MYPLFQNKQRDIALIISGVLLLFCVFFFAPRAYNALRVLERSFATSIVSAPLSPQEKEEWNREVRETKRLLTQEKENAKRGRMFFRQGVAYGKLGLVAKAEKSYRSAIREDPSYKEALISLADTRVLRNEYKDAEQFFRRAAALAPGERQTYVKLADVYQYGYKDEFGARGIYLDGLIKTGNDTELMKNFATFLEVTGERREAFLYWEEVVKREPDNESARERLAALKPLVQP